MKFSLFTLFACLFSVSYAHFTLDYPLSRGFDEDLEPNFCGGFNLSTTRQPFPLGRAPLLIDSHHPSAQVVVLVSFVDNPTSFANFNTTSSGATYGTLTSFGTITGEGEFCFDIDVSSLNVAGVTNGSLATIQVEFNGGDGTLFQCSDVILLSNFTVPSNVSCTNSTATTTTSSAGASSTTATGSVSMATTTSKPAGVGRLEVGGAFLAVGLGLVALIV